MMDPNIPLVVAAIIALFFAWVLYLYSKINSTTQKLTELHEKEKENIFCIIKEKEAEIVDIHKSHAKTTNELNAITERFSAILDAELEADKIIKEATETAFALQVAANEKAHLTQSEAIEFAKSTKLEAIKYLENAQRKGANIQEEINQKSMVSREQIRSLMATSQKIADKIIAETNERVQENIDFEKALKAMRNQFEGYGMEYIIPVQNYLDDLADEFGFTEAGQALKAARIYSQLMVKDSLAGLCDYVEDYRRRTAIAFIVDAFNGKVDSILGKMNHNNSGKLIQEVHDAYALVNANGQAFRNARISPDYLAARLEEIKWGAIALELRERAKEEQRAIKEQIREEERARKEHERALKQAVQEEEKAQIALEKARLALAKAETDAMKEKLALRIADLEETYAKAKERENHAISMAQLTKSGHIYIISNQGSFGSNVIKIGMTRRLEPLDRVKELGDASVPFAFDVHAIIYSKDAPALENELHRRFSIQRMNKVNFRKEFFRASLTDIKSAVEELGVQAHFTLAAESKEYFETLAIEQLPAQEQEQLLASATRDRSLLLRDILLDDDDEIKDVL